MDEVLNLLAIDLGAESGRAMLGSFDGERITLRELHRFANGPVSLPDGLHWNILGLWKEIQNGLLAARAANGTIAGLGVDTWGVDFGLLDKHGTLLGNPYHYRDSRTDTTMDAAFQRIPRADIYTQTGTQFMQFNTLFQLFSMVLQGSPQIAAAETFLTIPDLLNYWMTGQKACEFTNATTTQCYDPRRKTWARPLLERLSIPTAMFPDIIPPGTILGPLLDNIASEVGLPGLPVIAPACHDTGSAVAAVPAQEENYVWISSGTWSIMGVEVREPLINQGALDARMTNEGGVGGTIRLSKNIMGLWPVQESRRTWANQGQNYSYGELMTLASEAESLRSIIDLDHHDFLKPGDMPARLRAYCARTGELIPETPGQVVRCFLEGIALKYRWVLEHLEGLLHRHLAPLHIVGGGTQNTVLSQFAADSTGRTVVTGPVEATAVGNLLMQAVALGRLDSISDVREVVRRSFAVQTYQPDPAQREQWERAYERLHVHMNLHAEDNMIL